MKSTLIRPEAAVLLVLLRERTGEKILLTRRAEHLREHPGEVAFPGGFKESYDTSLYRTGLRECSEEVGLLERQLTFRAELMPHYTRSGMPVTPFVVDIDQRSDLNLCADEIASAKWVPLSLFLYDQRSLTHVFRHKADEYWAPVYHYEDYEIWGLTARVIVSFINRFYGGQIQRQHLKAQERYYAYA